MPPIAFTRLVVELLRERLLGHQVGELDDLALGVDEVLLRLDRLYRAYLENLDALQPMVNEYLDTVSAAVQLAERAGCPVPVLRPPAMVEAAGAPFAGFAGDLVVCLGDTVAAAEEEPAEAGASALGGLGDAGSGGGGDSADTAGEEEFMLWSEPVSEDEFELLLQLGLAELRRRFSKAEVEVEGGDRAVFIQVGGGEGWESSFVLLPEFRMWAAQQLGEQPYYAMPLTGSVLVLPAALLDEQGRAAIQAFVTGDAALSGYLFWEGQGGMIEAEPL